MVGLRSPHISNLYIQPYAFALPPPQVPAASSLAPRFTLSFSHLILPCSQRDFSVERNLACPFPVHCPG